MVVNYQLFTRLKTIILTSFFSILLVQVVVYFSPENQGWWNSPYFSWGNMLQFVFIDQILIECFSVFITFICLRQYAQFFKLENVVLSRVGIIKYELTFLPVALLAFFIFNPITQTLRFLYDYIPELIWEDYWKGYFYSIKLYLTYLPIVFLQVYAVLNINLFKNYAIHLKINHSTEDEIQFIKVNTPHGHKLVDQKEIIYVQKIDRKYHIVTVKDSYTTNLTISQLEKLLSQSAFIRVNRSTLIKINKIDFYAYWKNDKYNVRLESGEEFTMSRQRLNKIKHRLVIK